jgi:hypothetical protein
VLVEVALVVTAVISAAGIYNLQDRSIFMPSVTAVTTPSAVGVYWDQAATNSCQYIYWGNLTPGSEKTLTVYLKNKSNESLYYLITTQQWNPVEASKYIFLRSIYDVGSARPANSGSVVPVPLTVVISPEIQKIVDFSFTAVVSASTFRWGDVNHDGHVDVLDLIIVSQSLGASPGSPNWNANADINGDGIVDVKDLIIAAGALRT